MSDLDRMEEQALLLIRPGTKAAAVSVVRHIAEYRLAGAEIQTWLLILLESPLVRDLN